jgi:putative chitinase
MIDYNCLRNILPVAVFDEILDCSTRYKIDTPLRLAHFLSQCAHESGGFKHVEENLNYSADGLLKVFGKYFNPTTAALYARAPESIASYVYASRMGNDTEASMDGWKYRGRGYIQLTGKNNYQRFDMAVPENIVGNPDLIATKYPLLSAAWFWDLSRLNEIADQGSSENDVAAITKKINGGMNGIAERVEWFNKFYGCWG